MNTEAKRQEPVAASITEADLEALDTQGVLDEPLRATDRVNHVFLQIGTGIALLATLGIGGLMLVNVIMRYVFGSSLPVASEGPNYFFGWLIAGGAIIAQSQMGHVAVDFIPSLLRPAARKAMTLVIWVVTTVLLVYGGYLAFYLTGVLVTRRTLVMGWPEMGSFSALIVMFAVLAVQALVHVVRIARTPAGALHPARPKEA